jgi:CRISPR-associated protein Cas2
MRRLWVVTYDIANDRRRVRLANALAGWGERVLESVFECTWRADQLPKVVEQLSALIDPAEDRLWLVPVCAACRAKARVNGQHRCPDDPPWHIV